LTPQTHHIVNASTLARVKRGALLINTSRGGLVDTEAAIEAFKAGQLGGIAIDVYEQEAGLFFRDVSSTVIPDDVIQRLVSFPNVILPGIRRSSRARLWERSWTRLSRASRISPRGARW
jgi:D-lactate dehydrogenase